MNRWLDLLKTLGPIIIATTVPNGALIAPAIVRGIEEAEKIKGASGAEKLAHVVEIAKASAAVAQASGVNIDPVEVETAAHEAISATVDVVNIVNKVKADKAA